MTELQRHDESIKNLLRAYITAMERGQPFSDVRGQLETAINKKRTTQGKKSIVLEGVSTRTRSTNINGEKRETKTVRLTYRKDTCMSRCIGFFKRADETYHI